MLRESLKLGHFANRKKGENTWMLYLAFDTIATLFAKTLFFLLVLASNKIIQRQKCHFLPSFGG
jgi:hypothetical protein